MRKQKKTEQEKKASKRPEKHERDPKKSLLIIAIGAVIMVVSHLVYWEFEKITTIEPPPEMLYSAVDFESLPDNYPADDSAYRASKNDMPPDFLSPPPVPRVLSDESGAAGHDNIVRPVAQNWKEHAAASRVDKAQGESRPRIAIIIDDMGVNRAQTQAVIDLPAPLTLAFLPYASKLESLTKRARERGHELMIHMPMEAMNGDLDTGPIAIKSGMSDDQIHQALSQAFGSFEGYVGINNHMGSRVTQDEHMMHVVMNDLARRGLLFVDSKTINSSVAADIARAHGLDYAQRDVFLDHEATPEFVNAALDRLERIAKERGQAIGIGHPKAVTVKALEAWLAQRDQKGVLLVPVSALVRHEESP